MSIDYDELAARFQDDDVVSIGLFGSHATGDFGANSDVDVVRFVSTPTEPPPRTLLVDDNYVVVSDVSSATVATWFNSPGEATKYLQGVRVARPLFDPEGYLDEIIQRAWRFKWDDAMQARADALVGTIMVGWIEEVQKTLEGLRRGDVGRMLNGKHGLTWGMLEVMRVKRGVLLSSDNGAFTDVVAAMGIRSPWSVLCRSAFGVGGSYTIDEELGAGLALYVLTATMVRADLEPSEGDMVDEVVRRIRRSGIVLPGLGPGG